jgi:hypothetical protein
MGSLGNPAVQPQRNTAIFVYVLMTNVDQNAPRSICLVEGVQTKTIPKPGEGRRFQLPPRHCNIFSNCRNRTRRRLLLVIHSGIRGDVVSLKFKHTYAENAAASIWEQSHRIELSFVVPGRTARDFGGPANEFNVSERRDRRNTSGLTLSKSLALTFAMTTATGSDCKMDNQCSRGDLGEVGVFGLWGRSLFLSSTQGRRLGRSQQFRNESALNIRECG